MGMQKKINKRTFELLAVARILICVEAYDRYCFQPQTCKRAQQKHKISEPLPHSTTEPLSRFIGVQQVGVTEFHWEVCTREAGLSIA